MRYFFHLTGPNDDGIHDESGIEAPNLEAAKAEALRAVHEILAEDDEADENWHGWQLEIADAVQRVLFTIALDLRPPAQYVGKQRCAKGYGRHTLHGLLAAIATGIAWDSLIPLM
jgi:hypothetical protein